MVKLVCCDLDNTLLFDKKGTISPDVYDIIEKLNQRSVLFAVASGRPVVDLLRLFAPVIEKIIIIAYDGAVVIYKGEIIFSRPIEKNIYMAFLDALKNSSLQNVTRESIFYTLGDAWVSDDSVFASKALEDSVTMNGHVVRTSLPEEVCEPVYKLSLLSEKGNHDFDYIVRDWSSYLNNIYTGSRWCEFVSKDTDKGFAMNLIMERFGISRGEVMAFGDGINDIEMLSACDFSYAMASSKEEVKIRAAFVTDNVVRSIKEFFSI